LQYAASPPRTAGSRDARTNVDIEGSEAAMCERSEIEHREEREVRYGYL